MVFDYMYSSHRKEYIALSFRYLVSPKHVYQLAHGKDAKSSKDQKILHELCEMGIIHHRKPRRPETEE